MLKFNWSILLKDWTWNCKDSFMPHFFCIEVYLYKVSLFCWHWLRFNKYQNLTVMQLILLITMPYLLIYFHQVALLWELMMRNVASPSGPRSALVPMLTTLGIAHLSILHNTPVRKRTLLMSSATVSHFSYLFPLFLNYRTIKSSI